MVNTLLEQASKGTLWEDQSKREIYVHSTCTCDLWISNYNLDR